MEWFKKIGKSLLYPHWAVLLLLVPAATAALIWVFLSGNNSAWFAYPIFVLAFYTLMALCIRLTPLIIRRAKEGKQKRDSVTPEQKEKRFHIKLYEGLLINLVYAGFNLLMGILNRSTWMGSVGLYHLILTLIHLILVLYQHKLDKTEEIDEQQRTGWSGFQMTGILLMILHLTMTGMVFQMIWQGEVDEYPGFFIFAVAAFTFYKLTIAIIRVVQYRKNHSPIWGAARNIDLSEAMMSMFSLQTALLAAFDDGTMDQTMMNSLTGGAVCLLAVGGAVGMIVHGSKRKKETGGA